MKYTLALKADESGCEVICEESSFNKAAAKLLVELENLFGNSNPDVFTALADLAGLDNGGKIHYRRDDFSTPEDNFTLTLEIS